MVKECIPSRKSCAPQRNPSQDVDAVGRVAELVGEVNSIGIIPCGNDAIIGVDELLHIMRE